MKPVLLLPFLFLIFACKNNTEKKSAETYSEVQKEISPEVKESIARGASLYNNFCATCHLSGGEGVEGVFPPLENSNWLRDKRNASIHAVKFGLHGPIEVNGITYESLMPDLGLTNHEIADIMNYIFNSWSNNIQPPVTEEEVALLKE